jgi:hypothetical protein
MSKTEYGLHSLQAETVSLVTWYNLRDELMDLYDELHSIPEEHAFDTAADKLSDIFEKYYE